MGRACGLHIYQERIGLVSLRDGLDLNTAAGRLMARVLAGVAAYEFAHGLGIEHDQHILTGATPKA